MPKVGKMKFPYTEQGMKDAANMQKIQANQCKLKEIINMEEWCQIDQFQDQHLGQE